MSKRCQIILWNNSRNVTGSLVEFSGRGDGRIVTRTNADPALDFPAQLTQVQNMLRQFRSDATLFAGAIPGAFLCELILPARSLREVADALAFELPRQFPGDWAEWRWCYRQIGMTPRGRRIRAFGCPEAEWQMLMTDLRQAGVTFDACCHPFMAVEASHDAVDCDWPEITPEQVWRHAEGTPQPLRELVPRSAPAGAAPDVNFLLAEYALSPGFQNDKRFLSPHPAELRRQHLRPLKLLTILTASAALILLAFWGWRGYDAGRARWNALEQELSDIEAVMDNTKLAMTQLAETSEVAQRTLAATDEADLGMVLTDLSLHLPVSSWVTTLRYSKNRLALTLNTSGETEAAVDCLSGELRGFAVENLRRQLNQDGSSTITATLLRASGEAP